MTSIHKWALLRAVVLTQKPNKKQNKPKKQNEEEERRRLNSSVMVCDGELLSSLREEQHIYEEKLRKIKQTVELKRILKSVAKQEKSKNKIVDEMRATEIPNVRTIKKSHLPTDNHLSIRCKERGNAQLQVRQKRADLGRMVAKKTATIQNLHTKLNIIINEANNDEKRRPTKKHPLKLPMLELKVNKKPLHIKESLTPREKFKFPRVRNEKQRRQKITHAKRENTSYNVLLGLIRKMEGLLDTLDKSTAADLKITVEDVKEELKKIDESIMHELKSIKSKQKLEARIQKTRVKYKEFVHKFYEREFWVSKEQGAKHEKLDDERERLRKIRYEQIQARLRRMKLEQEMFGYMANSRFTQRGFSYFHK